MHWWIDYWKENLHRSLALWERHQVVSILVGMLVGAIPAVISGWLTDNIGIGLLVWFGCLVFLITPMRIWKEQTDRLKVLTKKRLILSVVERDREVDGRGNVWWHIKVENPSSEGIKNCYGKLESFIAESTDTPRANLPFGVRFPWTSRGGANRQAVAIGANSSDYLDIVMTKPDTPDYFFTPTLAANGWSRNLEFPLGKGVYMVGLAVGSDTEAFPPTKARFKVIFEGYDKLEIQEFSIID